MLIDYYSRVTHLGRLHSHRHVILGGRRRFGPIWLALPSQCDTKVLDIICLSPLPSSFCQFLLYMHSWMARFTCVEYRKNIYHFDRHVWSICQYAAGAYRSRGPVCVAELVELSPIVPLLR